ncbi:hypothetical protein [Arthrobacter sp. TMS1-12-1]
MTDGWREPEAIKLGIYGDSIGTGWRGVSPPKGRRLFDLHYECAKETGLPFIRGQRGVFADDYLPYLYPEEVQLHPNDKGTRS